MNTTTQPASTDTQRSLRGEDSQKSRGQSQDTSRAVDAALSRATWHAKPFEPSRTQGKAITASTALAAVVGTVVTACITATPWVFYFAQR